MRVAHDDLILSTQGRSFWILDDLTPLRQLDATVASSAMHLYAPRPAYRGTNADSLPTRGEWAPDPLPGNALIHYYFAQAPAAAVDVEIHDSSGRFVRAFTSDSARAAEERLPRITARAGMNRMRWDLTYAGPETLKGAVISGYSGGVKAPPGTYRVTLTADGESRTSPLEVHPDPRLTSVTADEYEEQFQLAMAVRDSASSIYDAARLVGSVREQLGSLGERLAEAGFPAGLKARADSLADALTGVEEELRQVKNQSNQDALRYPPKLDNQYLVLYAYVNGVDNYSFGGPEGRPTAGAYERLEDLNALWAELRARLDVLLDSDLPALNQELERSGVPAVIVPRESDRPLVP